MWLDLILQRLEQHYYRSPSELLNDIELIAANAKVYNTASHVVSIEARKVVDAIKLIINQLLPQNYQERLI